MICKRYRCPDCSGVFVYEHHPSIAADPLPDGAACPHCGFVAESEYPPAVVAPSIRKTIVRAVDGLNRAMEEGAEFRAQMAQETFGLSAQETMAMKETNSLDRLREGDTSAMPVVNAVTRAIDAAPQAYGFSGGAAQGAQLSPSVQSGPFANAGARAMAEVRGLHQGLVSSTGHNAVVTSSAPALETQQPGYRKRV